MPVEILSHERAADAIMATYLLGLHSGIMRLQHERKLARTFQAFFPEARHLNEEYLNDLLERRLRDTNLEASSKVSQDLYHASTTRLNFQLHPTQIPTEVREAISNVSILAVGGGLANLVRLAALYDASFGGLNLETIDPNGIFGGQWVTDPDGLGVTINNPALSHLDADLTVTTRDNLAMRRFINQLERRFYRQQPIKGKVARLQKTPFGRSAILETGKDATPGRSAQLTYLALGNHPLPLESRKMNTNAREFESSIFRNQRPIGEEEARKLDNKSILIVGLGNSALRQVQFIREANEKYHTNISPIILTHFTSHGLWNPDEYHIRADGTWDQASRNLEEGKTTNLELDIESSNRLYHQLLYSSTLMDSSLGQNQTTISGIIPSVTGYYINQTENGYQVTVTISDQHEKDIGGYHLINNVGAIFVLAGYGVPAEMLEKMGVQSMSGGRAKVKPHVGAAYLLDDTLDPSLLVGGIAMTSQEDPSDNTLPGMLGHLPNQLFHTALYAMSNYRN